MNLNLEKIVKGGIMLMALAAFNSASALPAPEGLIEALQPDGTTVLIRQSGDAFRHDVYSSDGYRLTADAEGFYVFADADAQGNPVATAIRAINPEMRSAADVAAISALDHARIEKAFMSANLPRKKVRKGPGLFSTRFPSKGENKSVVILVQFADNEFTIENPREFYHEMLNSDNFTYNDATGSARQYFIDNSNGEFKPTFDIYGPVTLPNPMSYYGGDDAYGIDANAYQMAIHACDILDDEVDFSQYDCNGDGLIDNVYIYYAGYGQQDGGGTNTVWPHSWDIDYGTLLVHFYDDVRLNHYACSNELRKNDNKADAIGPFCHEFSHVMGLPDLYQTDTSKGTAYTPESWSLIASGSYNNKSRTPAGYSAYERYALDWMEPELLTEPGEYSLPPINTSNKAFLVTTDDENEYFLIENRQRDGWDAYLPNHGMLVWHIDFDQDIWDFNQVNNDPRHQHVDIVEADPVTSQHAKDCFPGRSKITSFTADGRPAFKSWKGVSPGFDITNIKEEADGTITFTVVANQYNGVEDIEMDMEAGEAVYYNLQGQPVANPEKGQLLIRIVNGKASKVIK